MEKKEGRKTDQTKQCKHSAPRNPLAHNNNTNSSSSNDRSSDGAPTMIYQTKFAEKATAVPPGTANPLMYSRAGCHPHWRRVFTGAGLAALERHSFVNTFGDC